MARRERVIGGYIIPDSVFREMEYIQSERPRMTLRHLMNFLSHPLKQFGGMSCHEWLEKQGYDFDAQDMVISVLRRTFLGEEEEED